MSEPQIFRVNSDVEDEMDSDQDVDSNLDVREGDPTTPEERFLAARAAYLRECKAFCADGDSKIQLEVTKDDIATAMYGSWEWSATKPGDWKMADDGKMRFSTNVKDLVEINNAHRRHDVCDGAGSDLWDLTQLKDVGEPKYTYEIPTVAPKGWPRKYVLSDQKQYTELFNSEFPEVSRILPMPNVVVCGGAAAWALGRTFQKPSDIDFFLYGLPDGDDSESRSIRWSCVSALIARIRNEFLSTVEYMSPGVITIMCYRKNYDLPTVKMQIILRAYKTVSSILHGFDIPSCCVAYDGSTAVVTTLAAFAHIFRVNVVVPEYRSTTYESRLIKYFTRGFAILLPNFDMSTIKDDEAIVLPWITITPTSIGGRVILGSVALNDTQPESDYTPMYQNYQYYNDASISRFGRDWINTKNLVAGKPLIVSSTFESNPSWRTGDYIAFNTFATNEPTKSTIFPKSKLVKALEVASKKIVNVESLAINVRRLKNVFGLDNNQINKFVHMVDRVISKLQPRQRINTSRALKSSCDAVLAKWDALPETINWWILHDPTRQYTSSINPRMEDSSVWYGASFINIISLITDEELLKSKIETFTNMISGNASQTAYDGTCSICFSDLKSGDRNSITLVCGHVFHAIESESCNGLQTWSIEGHESCPICRAMFDGSDGAGGRRRRFRRGSRQNVSGDLYIEPL